MKKTLLTVATLALLAGTTALIRAADTTNPPDMNSRIIPTNTLPTGTNAPAKPYPLKTCIVSGDKIGEMGEPVKLIYKGQEMKFCCKDCVKTFKKDPDKWIKKLTEAQKKEAAAKK